MNAEKPHTVSVLHLAPTANPMNGATRRGLCFLVALQFVTVVFLCALFWTDLPARPPDDSPTRIMRSERSDGGADGYRSTDPPPSPSSPSPTGDNSGSGSTSEEPTVATEDARVTGCRRWAAEVDCSGAEKNNSTENSTHARAVSVEAAGAEDWVLSELLRSMGSRVDATRIVANGSQRIYMSMKTTASYHAQRLPPVLLTWLRTIAGQQVKGGEMASAAWRCRVRGLNSLQSRWNQTPGGVPGGSNSSATPRQRHATFRCCTGHV